MTGLYKNVSKLQDDKSPTFLYKTPKINLEALNISSIATSYKNILDFTEDKSIKLC